MNLHGVSQLKWEAQLRMSAAPGWMIGVISSLVKPRESDQKKRGTTEDNASDRCRRLREERTDPTPAGGDSHVYSRSNTRMLLGLL